MRLLVLSDVHANLEALEACLKLRRSTTPSSISAMWWATTPHQTKSASAFASWSVQSCAAITIAPARACRTFRNSTWSRPYPRAGRRWSSIPTIASGCTICPRDRFQPDTIFRASELVHGSPRDEDEYVLTRRLLR